MRRVLLTLVMFALPGAQPLFAADIKDPIAKFETFCVEWMGKLAVRERDNRAHVRWEPGPDGTHGEYVGYSQDHTCKVKENSDPKAVPIGQITYRELLFRQSGASAVEAEKSVPQVIEVTEVIEIFRFDKGKWVY